MASVNVVGIRCEKTFDDIVKHFKELGGDVILMDPDYICGIDHVLSAVMHAERAFKFGTNRSKTLLTETILYAAGERQISKALIRMRPKEGCIEMVAAVFDVDDLRLSLINAVEDDRIILCTADKAMRIGLDTAMAPPEDMILEMVAMTDIQKQ